MGNRVTALIPAHNEEEVIVGAISALLSQSRPPDRLVVVSDNSTDSTVELARSFGPSVEVWETTGNTDMKSGALNQALDRVDEDDSTFVLVVDADTKLSHDWIKLALQEFEDPEIGAVGGVFLGDRENGLLGDLQGLEYARYKRQLRRDYGKARVLTGTSTITRMGTLREVKRRRDSGEFPGRGYYNVDALTEDFDLTLCIKRLGLKTTSPDSCTVVTETMPSVPMLWKQRVRWQRGALDALKAHRVNRVTFPYAARQVEAGLGVLANFLLIGITVWAVVTGSFVLIPFWIAIGALFLVERVVSGKEYGGRGVAIAVTIVADMAFDLFISAVWIWCLWLTVSNGKRGWGVSTIDTIVERG